MGSINKSHHPDSGGVILFSGEIILLFCDSVNCEVDGVGSSTGRIFLTTHRLVYTASKSPKLQSLSAPFFAMFDLKLEQPVFGANYIKGKVKNEDQSRPPLVFKLKFNSGGAIELGQAMTIAARQAATQAQQSQFVPSYDPPPPYSAAASHYVDPNSAYNPNYNVGFALPTQIFNQAPPAGFIYGIDAPPPYPGMVPGFTPPSYPSYPYTAGGGMAANGAASGGAFGPASAPEMPPPYDAGKKTQ